MTTFCSYRSHWSFGLAQHTDCQLSMDPRVKELLDSFCYSELHSLDDFPTGGPIPLLYTLPQFFPVYSAPSMSSKPGSQYRCKAQAPNPPASPVLPAQQLQQPMITAPLHVPLTQQPPAPFYLPPAQPTPFLSTFIGDEQAFTSQVASNCTDMQGFWAYYSNQQLLPHSPFILYDP
jgi:hypothetical protein